MRYISFRECIVNLITKLERDSINSISKKLSPELYEKIYEHLIENLEYNFIRILYEEYRRRGFYNLKEYIELSKSNKFIDEILLQYPQLKIKYQKKIKDYFKYIEEINDNYISDKENINLELKQVFGELIDIQILQGDNHNGKSATKIITQNGVLYYKPVNSLNIQFFYEIIDVILKEKKDIEFKKINFYSTRTYMWMEEVKYLSCQSKQQVENYFYISGIYLMFFYIIGSYDMHYENIISNASTPVIIDYETLFNAQVSQIYEYTRFKDSVNSVINTSFIPFVNEKGAFDINLSGILCKSQESKKYTQHIYYLSEDIFEIREVKSQFIIKNQVTMNGKEIINDVFSEDEIRLILRKGFEYAGKVILNNKAYLKNIILKYLSNEDFECRQLLRPTQVYHQFIQATLHFNALKSSTEEEKVLNILEKSFIPTDFGYLRVEEEIEKIRLGYIPKFYTYGLSRNLYSDNSQICKNYFIEPIIESVTKKIDLLDYDQIVYQMHLIDLSILTLYKKQSFGNTKVRSKGQGKQFKKEDVKKLVEPLVKRISSYKYSYDGKISTIFLPHLSDTDDMWLLKDMEANLYENGGLILLLAAYGDTYDDLETLKNASELLDYLNLRKEDKSLNNLSVFSGIGCLAYLNYFLYRIFIKKSGLDAYSNKHKQMYFDIEKKILKYVVENELGEGDFDYIHGIISSVSFVFNVRYVDKQLKEHNSLLMNDVVDKLIVSIKEEYMKEIGFAHGITGLLYCLSNIFLYASNSDLISIIDTGLSIENNLILKKGENLKPTWCRGTTGIIYGRLLIFQNIKKQIKSSLHNKLFFYNKSLCQKELLRGINRENNMSLCHGIYGNIEIILKLKKELEQDEIIIPKYFDSFDDLNWVDELNIPIDLFMLGNSGVGYVLLEFVNSSLPSVLALKPFN